MKIHTFESTFQAQDQVWDFNSGLDVGKEINNGDILIIESEGVVGVVGGNLFAVTKKQGEFPDFIIDWLLQDPKELKRLVDAIPVAISEATRLGFEVEPKFMCFAS